MWHVRFYVDVPGQEKLQRKSLPIGPAVGKDKLTKPEAVRKGSEMIAAMGVNSEMHLERDQPESYRDVQAACGVGPEISSGLD
jgi:hypothetical protein